jgi:hypothetical protein
VNREGVLPLGNLFKNERTHALCPIMCMIYFSF